MHLKDVENIDPAYDEIVVLFNARPDEVTFGDPAFADKEFTLHSIQAGSRDEVVRASKFDSPNGAFKIPGRTTAVFSAPDKPIPTQATATQTMAVPVPAIADPNVLLTLVGVVGAFVAVVAMMLALGRKPDK
jgi:alpha-1,6-glucosidase-like protein